jgi:hypothetical protein
MGVLKAFLYVCAAAFLLGGILPAYLLGFGLFTGLALAVGAALAYATFKAARGYQVAASESQKLQFEQVVKQLAEKNGGTVPISAIMNATGETKDGARKKMRELVSRGVVEPDFGANGEMLFKLTPFDEARANLAALRDRTP